MSRPDLELVDGPSAPLVSLDEAKAHLRLHGIDDHDDRVGVAIAATMGQLDGWSGVLGRALVTQTWRLWLDAFPRAEIRLPLPPVAEILGIAYINLSGATVTLSPSAYQLLGGERAAVRPAYGLSWPSARANPRAVSITYVCGVDASSTWPDKLQPIRAAALLMIETHFSGPDPARDAAAKALLTPLRIPRL